MYGDLISIIIPLFNVENFIEECLQSVENQTYDNIEVIMVNDGSTDRTEEICKKYAEKDKRFHLISQKNQGVAIARKVGISQASGQFIGFVDGDDWVEQDYYARLMEYSGMYDLITAGYRNGYGESIGIFDNVGQRAYLSPNDMKYIIDNMIIYNDTEQHGITTFLWNKLFRADYAKEVSTETSEKIVIGEDSEFVYRYILKSKSIYVSDICGYYYRMRENSAIHSLNKRYLTNINELYCSLESAFRGHIYQENLMLQLQKWTSRMISMSGANMGFSPDAQCMAFVFPFINQLDGKRIVLYGAGKIGQNYYMQIRKWKICEIERWVDKNWKNCRAKGMEVSPVESLRDEEYDYLIIAVQEEKLALDIKERLVEMGLNRERLLWKAPLSTIM